MSDGLGQKPGNRRRTEGAAHYSARRTLPQGTALHPRHVGIQRGLQTDDGISGKHGLRVLRDRFAWTRRKQDAGRSRTGGDTGLHQRLR